LWVELSATTERHLSHALVGRVSLELLSIHKLLVGSFVAARIRTRNGAAQHAFFGSETLKITA
jgi:hypothetical protein